MKGNAIVEEHPEDRKVREDGEAYGHANAASFCKKYEGDIVRLIGTYADSLAESLLEELRERFWLRGW